jgi:hypothetical protein
MERAVIVSWNGARWSGVWFLPLAALGLVVAGSPTVALAQRGPLALSGTLPRSSSEAPPLQTLMLTVVPSGFVLQPDSVGDTGPSNLAKAARDDGRPGAKTALKRAGFVRGFQRLWIKPGATDENILFLYQFRSKAGATVYSQRAHTTFQTGSKGQRPVAFAVMGIPGAFGFEGPLASGGKAAIVVFQQDVHLVLAVANASSGTDETAAVQQLALAQFMRLTAGP